jgi:hypothetical protein
MTEASWPVAPQTKQHAAFAFVGTVQCSKLVVQLERQFQVHFGIAGVVEQIR